MSICQLGMHKNVQDHTNANVCKQTYDASCKWRSPSYGVVLNLIPVTMDQESIYNLHYRIRRWNPVLHILLHCKVSRVVAEVQRVTVQTPMSEQTCLVRAVALLCLCQWITASAKRATVYGGEARSTPFWDASVRSGNSTSYGVPAQQILTRRTSADHFSKVR